MEFLGDAVLDLIICEALYLRFPQYLEGDLTKIKSAVVSRRTCAEVANETGLTDLLIIGKGISSRKPDAQHRSRPPSTSRSSPRSTSTAGSKSSRSTSCAR